MACNYGLELSSGVCMMVTFWPSLVWHCALACKTRFNGHQDCVMVCNLAAFVQQAPAALHVQRGKFPSVCNTIAMMLHHIASVMSESPGWLLAMQCNSNTPLHPHATQSLSLTCCDSQHLRTEYFCRTVHQICNSQTGLCH